MKAIKITHARKAALAAGAAIVATALTVGSVEAAAPAFACADDKHICGGLGPSVSAFARTQAHGSGGGAGAGKVSAFVHSLQRGGSGLP